MLFVALTRLVLLMSTYFICVSSWISLSATVNPIVSVI